MHTLFAASEQLKQQSPEENGRDGADERPKLSSPEKSLVQKLFLLSP